METKLNIAEILKNKPKGTKLYSPLFGDVYLLDVDNNIIRIKYNEEIVIFFGDGRYYNYSESEPLLFPSKEMRDWSKFTWKKGDMLVSRKGSKILFDKWASEDYTKFLGKIKILRNSHCYDTAYYTLASKEEALEFIKSVEEINNGKLNLETLEIEKQHEFKDGDIVVYKCEIEDVPDVIFIFRGIDQLTPYYSYYASLDSDGFLSYKLGAFGIYNRELRLATEEEKQQLLDALAKRGKAWDAEKKQIVDLKPKIELKPFDKVLVRDDKEDQWSANIFSYQVRGMFHCLGEGYWKYCIPYEGNEHLLGTTKNVED